MFVPIMILYLDECYAICEVLLPFPNGELYILTIIRPYVMYLAKNEVLKSITKLCWTFKLAIMSTSIYASSNIVFPPTFGLEFAISEAVRVVVTCYFIVLTLTVR